MEGIVKTLKDRGLTTSVFDDYLQKGYNALSEAYNASENEGERSSYVKLGEAKAYMDFVMACWKEMKPQE